VPESSKVLSKPPLILPRLLVLLRAMPPKALKMPFSQRNKTVFSLFEN
jgi:hypothetical protein